MTATDPNTDRVLPQHVQPRDERFHWQIKANAATLAGFHHLAQGLAKLAKSEIARATVAAGIGEVEP